MMQLPKCAERNRPQGVIFHNRRSSDRRERNRRKDGSKHDARQGATKWTAMIYVFSFSLKKEESS